MIVAGAGIAGLAAARALGAKGFEVVVIEARDRIGGRVFTDRSWPGIPVDLGASWIHGVTGNPVAELARSASLATRATDYEADALFDATGRALTDAESAAIDALWERFVAAIEAERERRDAAGEGDVSLRTFIDLWSTSEGLDEVVRSSLEHAVNTRIEHEYAADAGDLSLLHYDDAGELGGGDVLFPDGFGRVVEHLAAGLDVRLGHEITEIAWGAEGVEVTTSRGVIEGDRVIVTLPLGVLKAGTVTFSPPLPSSKSGAISRLGFGILDKLFLRFPSAFWSDADAQVLNWMGTPRGAWAESLNIHAYTGQPVLLCFNAGAYAEVVEAKPDADVVADAMRMIRAVWGADVDAPEAWAITRWGRDPHARGAYSHLAPGSTRADHDALAAPLGDRVFFAGEATASDHPGTVHGAYGSGLREAERIARLTGR